MKGALFLIALFALSMLIIPLILVGLPEDTPPPSRPEASLSTPSEAEIPAAAPQHPPAAPVEAQGGAPAAAGTGEPGEPDDDFGTALSAPAVAGVAAFRILDETTGEIHVVSARDFVRGAVAAEMPALFHPEALKAQAVAAHTYALHRHMLALTNPDPLLLGADFSADPGNRLVYMTEETAREFYGDFADESWEKICEAADAVVNYALFYEEEPIVAAYHAISTGRTEDAGKVWTGSAPYLVPADSAGDLLAPDYETVSSFSAEELKQTLLAAYPDLELAGDPGTWFGEATRSASGYVTELEVGGAILHGKTIRELLGLRSHSFDITAGGSAVTFTVYGYGHGVGLSQYGADFMARQGADFREILANYYQGAVLVELTGVDN